MSIPKEPDPYTLFAAWFDEAKHCAAIADPDAMILSTVDRDMLPDSRVVLLKDFSAEGFVFFTNLTSAKSRELEEIPKAALNFHWMPLEKQVRVRGRVEPVTEAEADEYFASRPKQSQIGAWASKQSQPYTERLEFERRIAKYSAKYAIGRVPRPPFWSGFRVVPSHIEFWLKQPYRLHDRLRYTLIEGAWHHDRLYP